MDKLMTMLPSDRNWRYRRNWRGKLILQVQITRVIQQDLSGAGYFDEFTVEEWVDAKLSDLFPAVFGGSNGTVG